jgi:hypothetical protein
VEAERSLNSGPFSFNAQQTRKNLEKALALAEASQNPQDIQLIPSIKKTLSQVQDMGDMMSSFPFMPGGMPNSPAGFRDVFANLFGGFGDREDEYEDEEPDESKPPPKRKRR